MLAFTTLAVSAALATTVLASSHDMGHKASHGSRLKLNKLKQNFGKRQGAVPAGAMLLTVANSSEPINFASMMAGSAPANATTPTYNGTALWFSQADGKMGACLNVSTDADLIIGVSTQFWNNTGVPSNLCGAKVFVTSGNKNITATLLDASGSNYTTLSVAAFRSLSPEGTTDVGMIPISYHFLNTSSSLLPNSTTNTSTLALASAAPASSAPLVALPVSSNPNGIPVTPVQAQAAPAAATTPAPNASAVAAASAAAASSKASADAAYASSTSAAAAAASSKAAADRAWASQQASSSSAAAAAASKSAADQVRANAQAALAPVVAPVTGGGSQVYHGGHGTFFYQNGIAGACGKVNQDWSRVIAIDQAMYNGGKNCGRTILVTRVDTGKTVTAVVADMCPTCDNDTSLDLSVGAFDALASQSEGLINISWQFI